MKNCDLCLDGHCICSAGNVACSCKCLPAERATGDAFDEGASLKDVLWAIERQTSFVFMYNEEDLDKIGKVDVDVQGDDIRTILNVCLKGTTLTYVLQDNVIVLKPTIPQKTVKEVLLKGKVVDEKKEPLPGVTILVKELL